MHSSSSHVQMDNLDSCSEPTGKSLAYLQTASQGMLEGVARVTEVLNQLTEHDLNRLPYVHLQVQLVDIESDRVVGQWHSAGGPGDWMYHDGSPESRV